MKQTIFISALAWSFSSCSTTLTGKITSSSSEIAVHHGMINVIKLDGKQTESTTTAIKIEPDGSFRSESDFTDGTYLIEPLIPGYEATSLKIRLDESKYIEINANPIRHSHQTSLKPNIDIRLGRGAGTATLDPPKY